MSKVHEALSPETYNPPHEPDNLVMALLLQETIKLRGLLLEKCMTFNADGLWQELQSLDKSIEAAAQHMGYLEGGLDADYSRAYGAERKD